MSHASHAPPHTVFNDHEVDFLQDYTIFKLLEDSSKTPFMCIAVAHIDGVFALENIPPYILTREICIHAVKSNPAALALVPEHFQHRELYLHAVDAGLEFNHIPDNAKDYQMCIRAVAASAWNLKHVPMRFRTRGLCQLAIRSQFVVFDYIPLCHRDNELYYEAINFNSELVLYIPEELVTNDMYLCALNSSDERLAKHIIDNMPACVAKNITCVNGTYTLKNRFKRVCM